MASTRFGFWQRSFRQLRSLSKRAVSWSSQKLQQTSLPQRLLIALLVVVGWLIYPQLASDVILIDPLIVPPKYNELGWTGETMSRRVRQELHALDGLARQAHSSLRTNALDLRLKLPTEIEAMSKIEVPGTKVNVTALVDLIREAFNRPSRRVQGEVVFPVSHDSSAVAAELTMRIATSREYQVLEPITAADPETLAGCAAETLLHELNPLLFALALFQQREFEAAHRVVSTVIHDPKWSASVGDDVRSNAFNLLGSVLLSQRDYDGAFTQYDQAIKIDPRNANLYANEGMAHHRRWREAKKEEDIKQAISSYEQAIRMDPKGSDHVDIYVNMGIAYQDFGDYGNAIAMYKQALQLDSNNVNALINWGVVYGHQRSYSEAIDKFREAITKDAEQPDSYINWGYALGLQGDFKGANEKFKQAASIAPQYAQVYSNWAEILHNEGQADRAAQMSAKARELEAAAQNSRRHRSCRV
jgi:tetratricopeptide (TPR) repeat protein